MATYVNHMPYVSTMEYRFALSAMRLENAQAELHIGAPLAGDLVASM